MPAPLQKSFLLRLFLAKLFNKLRGALTDLLPIILVIVFFQFIVLRQPLPHVGEILLGGLFVVAGLMLFIEGLEIGLFPIGEAMADALARKGSLAWLLTFAFALGFALLRGGRYSTWIVLGMAIACFGALRTFSKMSMLTIIAVAAFQLLQSTTTVRARLRVLGFALVTLGGVYWLLTTGLTLIDWQAGQLERLMEIREILLNQELNEETTTSRTLILRIGMEKFSQNPILGQGLGSFHSMPEAMGWGTHNTYLMVAGEAGIFALALLFMFLVRWAIEAMRCKDPVVRQLALNYILLFCLGCMSSHNMLNHRFHNIMFGLTFGLLSGRAYYMNRKQAEEAAEAATQHAQRHPAESEPAVAAVAAAEPA